MRPWLFLRSVAAYVGLGLARDRTPKLSASARMLLGVVDRATASGQKAHPFGIDYEAAAELSRGGYLHALRSEKEPGSWTWSLTEKGKKALED